MGKPTMKDYQLLAAAGINPLTGEPIRAVTSFHYKDNVKKLLRIKDEQEAVNRYRWYNLPFGLSSQEFERLLYYKYDLAAFKLGDRYYVMPYASDGTIDFYARFNTVHPVPMGGTNDDTVPEQQKKLLASIKLNVIKEVQLEEDFFDKDGNFDVAKAQDVIDHSCVIIRDYSQQLSQNGIPRQQLQEGIIDVESDCIPFMRTALLAGTGITGLKVRTEDEASNVTMANKSVEKAALCGEPWIPMVGDLDFQDLTNKGLHTADQYLLAMQSLDNFRHSTLGLDNAGLFQKSQYVTDGQNQVNAGNIGLVAQDGLSLRQRFCDIWNSIHGTGMWCEIAEPVIGIDKNMDGEVADEQDQSGEMEGEQDVTQ